MNKSIPEMGILSDEINSEDQTLVREMNKNRIVISYKECMKNHAAAIGGNARDGCGEFFPIAAHKNEDDEEDDEEGYGQSLTCSACGCHRNFHRKEILLNRFLSNPFQKDEYPIMGRSQIPNSQFHPHHCCSNINFSASSSMDNTNHNHTTCQNGFKNNPFPEKRKRFRTKFTDEQKEKMKKFAERAGWGMQNVDELAVKEVCEDVGIKRRVLKVWMHNNKSSYLAKKLEHN